MSRKILKNIKVLVWDVDGTLYRSLSYYQAIAQNEIGLLAKVKGVSKGKAAQLLKEKKKFFKSATKTLVKLGCGDISEVGRQIEIEDKERYFKKDPKLLEVFKKLTQFRHLTLRNGTYKGTIETLKTLGLDELQLERLDQKQKSSIVDITDRRDRAHPRVGSEVSFGPFERVFGVVDDFGTVKPDPIVFEKVLEYTGLPASQHLMIGDRVEVDLVPAKKIGMRTCLAWSKSNDPSVDVSISEVYDIVNLVNND